MRSPLPFLAKIKSEYPHLSKQDGALVLSGLRDFFHLSQDAEGTLLSMPSQVVDIAWHEFILSTRAYEEFCLEAFGHFLHHTPTEAMQSTEYASEGIKRTWALACKRESIDPKAPTKLPLLFALDAKLEIEKGYKYSLDCRQPGSNTYCAMHIGQPWLPTTVDSSSNMDTDSLPPVGTRCGGMFDGIFGNGSGSGGGCSSGGFDGGGCGSD